MKYKNQAYINKKILVVGDLMLDKHIIGRAERISPEAPVPVLLVEREKSTIGGAGNVALNLKYAGCDVDLVGVIGKDEAGSIFVNKIKEAGMPTSGLLVAEDRITTKKTRVMAQHQQIVRIDYEERNFIDTSTEQKIIEFINTNLDDYGVIILSDYCKGVVTERIASEIISHATSKGVQVVVDTKNPDISWFKNCTVVTPNHKEARGITGLEDDVASGKLIQKLVCSNVLITQGERGMTLFYGDLIKNFPTAAQEVFDVTGAGDTVTAFIAYALSWGRTLEQAVKIANIAAGIVVGKIGAAQLSLAEVKKLMSETYE